MWWVHGGVVVSPVTSQQEDSCFKSQLGPFCVEFACFSRVCVGSLPLPKTGGSKQTLGVSVNVEGCLSLFGSVLDW